MNKRGLDIAALTPEERLDLLEELWDSLAVAPEAIPLTEAQRVELDRRLDDPVGDGEPRAAVDHGLALLARRPLSAERGSGWPG